MMKVMNQVTYRVFMCREGKVDESTKRNAYQFKLLQTAKTALYGILISVKFRSSHSTNLLTHFATGVFRLSFRRQLTTVPDDLCSDPADLWRDLGDLCRQNQSPRASPP